MNRLVSGTYVISQFQQRAKGSHEAAFVEVFETMDSDNDGSITVQDIVNYMTSKGQYESMLIFPSDMRNSGIC